VVGVQKKQGAVPFGNKDDTVAIPITTAMRRLFRAEYIRAINAQAVSLARMKDAEEEIHQIINQAHKKGKDEPSDVRIHNQGEVVETATQQSTFLTMLLSGIAMISLVVGGIGIMNIMLVTVTERTREIGIRRAIGAKRKHILYQFLIESITLSLMGGVLGIGIGVGVAIWMGTPAESGGLGFTTHLTMAPMILSFASSALVGIFFGIYPAMKASALDPITALRHE
jgi:putative ABC transport system permease protein